MFTLLLHPRSSRPSFSGCKRRFVRSGPLTTLSRCRLRTATKVAPARRRLPPQGRRTRKDSLGGHSRQGWFTTHECARISVSRTKRIPSAPTGSARSGPISRLPALCRSASMCLRVTRAPRSCSPCTLPSTSKPFDSWSP
eukprot:Amastigsp_a4773_7.p4 type:complete len:140 gc:universal Amastigsp_a4773_7:1634-1215(-)